NKTKNYGADDPTFTGSIGNPVKETDLGTVEYARNLEHTTRQNVGDVIELIATYTTNVNYDVTVVPGKLTIISTARPADAQAAVENYDGVYDAKAHTIKVTNLLADDTLSYSYDGGTTWSETLTDYTDVTKGSIPVLVRVENPNYDWVKLPGTVRITPKPVTITVDNKTKNYGADDPKFTGAADALINENDLGTIHYVRAAGDEGKTNVGDQIALTVTYSENPNYTVTIKPGKLDIAAVDTNGVNVESRTVTYDGKAYGLQSAKALQKGSTLHYSIDNVTFSENVPTFTAVGTYTVYVKATHTNYAETATAAGTVTVVPREITITAASASKVYDGTDLVNTNVSITAGTLANNQTLTGVTVIGSQNKVGTSANVPSGATILSAGKDMAENYKITYVNGSLTVTPARDSGGDDGDGGNNGGNNNGYQPGGPGDRTTTILPEEIPLASFPGSGVGDGMNMNNLTTIDDGEVPLAGLPKTGNGVATSAWMMLLSGLLLAAYAMVGKKKEDNQE
ncbi:MAG: doubled motif LPXTG anchor domain-containing protein, partial [Hungatella sp.]